MKLVKKAATYLAKSGRSCVAKLSRELCRVCQMESRKSFCRRCDGCSIQKRSSPGIKPLLPHKLMPSEKRNYAKLACEAQTSELPRRGIDAGGLTAFARLRLRLFLPAFGGENERIRIAVAVRFKYTASVNAVAYSWSS